MIQVYNLACAKIKADTFNSRPRSSDHVRNKSVLNMGHSEVNFCFWVNNVLSLGQLAASSAVVHTGFQSQGLENGQYHSLALKNVWDGEITV